MRDLIPQVAASAITTITTLFCKFSTTVTFPLILMGVPILALWLCYYRLRHYVYIYVYIYIIGNSTYLHKVFKYLNIKFNRNQIIPKYYKFHA